MSSGRKHEVGNRGRRAAVGQLIAAFSGHAFGNRQAAVILQRRNAERAVAAGAGQHHADRLLGPVLGQRDQETVDGRPLARRLLGRAQRKPVAMDGHDHVWRAKIDRPPLDLGSVLWLLEPGALELAYDVPQPGFVQSLAKVHDEHHGEGIAKGQLGDEALDAGRITGRSTDADDQRPPRFGDVRRLGFTNFSHTVPYIMASHRKERGQDNPVNIRTKQWFLLPPGAGA